MPPPTADTLLNRFVLKAKFRHMQVLIRLTELGSMRRTALAVNMTQPAVSQLVAELEKLLETQLFFRHARGVAPTEATKDLIPVAQRILDALGEGSEAIANRLVENEGVVRVASSPAAAGGLLHGAMGPFAEANPGILVHIVETSGTDPLGSLAGSAADIVCNREPNVIPKGWVFDTCCEDSLIAVCGEGHPLANRSGITAEELGACKWLLNRVGSVARSRFEDLARKHDWPSSARCQVIMHIPFLTYEMLRSDAYLAILPRSVAAPWLEDGSVREVDADIAIPLAPLGILWREQNAGEAATRLANHLKAHAGQTNSTAR